MVSDNDTTFSDAHGWSLNRYYKKIILIEDSYGIFIISCGHCRLRIYKLIENDVFSFNQCDIEYWDENGWGMRNYYSTVGVTVVK